MDPFQILPYNCQHKVLRYINGKDLLKMCEVSTSWKLLIESDEYLMDKAMNGTVLKFRESSGKDFDVYGNFTEEEKFLKKLKHMTVHNINLIRPTTLVLYSQSLVNLKIESILYVDTSDIPGCTFPNLQKLEIIYIRNDWINWLLKCEFPSIGELNIEEANDDDNYEENKSLRALKLLSLLPTLKHLRIRLENEVQDDMIEILNRVPCTLETFDYSEFDHYFIRKHVNTLKTLKLQTLAAYDLSFIIRNCVNLEKLLVSVVDDRPEVFNRIAAPNHENVKTLEIQSVHMDTLRIFLVYFPNLETLIISRENCQPSDISFFGNYLFIFKVE